MELFLFGKMFSNPFPHPFFKFTPLSLGESDSLAFSMAAIFLALVGAVTKFSGTLVSIVRCSCHISKLG